MNGQNEDIWSKWLKLRRFGGDDNYQRIALEEFKKLASKIVNKAEIFDTATVLDIGSGDGIVGFTALSKLGPKGKLILSDISEAALAIPFKVINEKEAKDSRVEFLVSDVQDLSKLHDSNVDRVLSRAVLLYVEDKQAAFNEIFRILRPGGVAVLMEPINQRHLEFGTGFFSGYKLDEEPLLSVRSLIQRTIDNSKSQNQVSLVGYNEHDLVRYSINAGFEVITLEYSLFRTSKARYPSWEAFFDTAPNPLASTLRELLTKNFTLEEFEKVESALKEVIKLPTMHINCQAFLILKK